MSRRSTSRCFAALASLMLVAVLPGAAAAAPGAPPPLPFVSQLDLACYRTEGYKPPPAELTLEHLNPVLAKLPMETVKLGERQQLCVPVAKNGEIPPPGIVDFVRWVDLSCYRIEGGAVNFPLTLSHLNPVVRKLGIQDAHVTMLSPEQLCVPVAKNGVLPPPEVLSFVRHIDLECYALRVLGIPTVPFPLTLGHLNPVLARLPSEEAVITEPAQLGLPVAKNGKVPPG